MVIDHKGLARTRCIKGPEEQRMALTGPQTYACRASRTVIDVATARGREKGIDNCPQTLQSCVERSQQTSMHLIRGNDQFLSYKNLVGIRQVVQSKDRIYRHTITRGNAHQTFPCLYNMNCAAHRRRLLRGNAGND